MKQARILRPYDGKAPGMPRAARAARKRKADRLDQLLTISRRRSVTVQSPPQITLPWPAPELWPNRKGGRHWSHPTFPK